MPRARRGDAKPPPHRPHPTAVGQATRAGRAGAEQRPLTSHHQPQPSVGREAVPACSALTRKTLSWRRPPPARRTTLDQPFTRWSIRNLADYLRTTAAGAIRNCREGLRCPPARRGITFQRTKTWKKPTDPDRDAKLDRIEHVIDTFPERTFTFDEFSPPGIRPTSGAC